MLRKTWIGEEVAALARHEAPPRRVFAIFPPENNHEESSMTEPDELNDDDFVALDED